MAEIMRHRTHLPSDVLALLREREGLIDIQAARAAGMARDRLRRLARAKLLVRMADGVYASAATVDTLGGWALYELRARAFVLSCSPDAFLTGWSAAAVWRLPTLGRPPGRPVVVRPKQPGRGSKDGVYGRILTAEVPPQHRWRLGHSRVVSREWTAAAIALTAPIPAALIVADAVAGQGGDIAEAVGHMRRWPGASRAHWVSTHTDPLAESPLETLGRFGIIAGALPMPVSNAWVGASRPEYRVDGLWPHHHAAHEADGDLKYNNRPDAAAIIAKEKEREWRLRRLGLDIVRYGFSIAAFRRYELINRFAQLLRDNPPRDEAIRWWKHVPGVGPVEPEPNDWPSARPTSIVLPHDGGSITAKSKTSPTSIPPHALS